MPAQLRKEVVEHCRSIARKYGVEFKADRDLKARVLRLEHALLPPRPKPRGRPANPETTRAIRLYNRFRRQHPREKPAETWDRVCRMLYSEYARLSKIEQQDICDGLRGRVKSRARSRRVRKSP
jgi:hypothetical protein